jgi:hypothetical protein
MDKQNKGETSMDLSSYFLTLEYLLMAATFIALILIFLYSYYGKEEEQTNEKS